jgi:three-Cys-motif partner protein
MYGAHGVVDVTESYGGTWSEAKLACVEDYIRAYLTVMQKQTQFAVHYVDAFAGSGRHHLKQYDGDPTDWPALFDSAQVEDAQEFVAGSPIRALRVSRSATRGFDKFVFIEMSRRKNRSLQATVGADFRAEALRSAFLAGEANRHLLEYVGAQDWTRTRTVVFLDPFGLEVRWETVEALANTRACDVWYLFPLGVQRMMTKNGAIRDTWIRKLDGLFGTHGWYDEFYQPNPQTSLFGDDDTVVRDASTEHVASYIVGRLATVFAGGVSKPAVLRFTNGAPFAALVMAVGNPTAKASQAALRIANHLTKGLGSK